jgi:Domain of unknown function (DUF5666)
MPSRNANNAMQRKVVLLLLVTLFSTSLFFAHGNEKHVMGTVKAIGAGSISVETTDHQVQTVQISSQTKFVRSGNPSSISELNVGDRVVIHAKPSGDKLDATEVKSGAQPKNGTSKK